MKKYFISFLIILSVLLFAEHTHKLKGKEIVAKGKKTTLKGDLIQKNDQWYLKSKDKLFVAHFGPQSFLESKGIKLKPKKNFFAEGYIYKNGFAVSSFIFNDSTVVLRDKTGKALWAESEHSSNSKKKSKLFYIVNPDKCIGCRLCVINCPVDAIEMVDGRAVIDADKCIGCGICANGNGKNFKGCPVDAIYKSE